MTIVSALDFEGHMHYCHLWKWSAPSNLHSRITRWHTSRAQTSDCHAIHWLPGSYDSFCISRWSSRRYFNFNEGHTGSVYNAILCPSPGDSTRDIHGASALRTYPVRFSSRGTQYCAYVVRASLLSMWLLVSIVSCALDATYEIRV